VFSFFYLFLLIINILIKKYLLEIILKYLVNGDWGLGIGDWGLGPIPNPQSPIPNPQSPIPMNIYINKIIKFI